MVILIWQITRPGPQSKNLDHGITGAYRLLELRGRIAGMSRYHRARLASMSPVS